jgi:hypothetical protein
MTDSFALGRSVVPEPLPTEVVTGGLRDLVRLSEPIGRVRSMGKQNRQRRSAKRRKHQQPGADRPAPPRNPFHHHTDEPRLTAQEKVEGILELASVAKRR